MENPSSKPHTTIKYVLYPVPGAIYDSTDHMRGLGQRTGDVEEPSLCARHEVQAAGLAALQVWQAVRSVRPLLMQARQATGLDRMQLLQAGSAV